MYDKIVELNSLLTKLSSTFKGSKQYVATQELKAKNIHLEGGSTLNINMNNMIFSIDIIDRCREIATELMPLFPSNKKGLDKTLNHYKNMLVQKALSDSDGRPIKAAGRLGITERQMRYLIQKSKGERL